MNQSAASIPAKLAIGSFEVVEVLHAAELQKLLAAVAPNLEHCRVSTPSEISPWLVDVEGALNIHGEPHFWSTKADMRGFKTAEDILQFAGALETSFEKAATQLSRPN